MTCELRREMFKKHTLADLRKKYLKCVKVEERTSKFLNFQYALEREISKRMRAKIYKACIKVLKNHGQNQFFMAKLHTDSAMNELCASDDHYEIESYFTKNKIPVVVYFD